MDAELEQDLGALAGEWDALADESGAPPFLRPGWIEAWWRAFGRGEIAALTVRDEGRLRAVLPLVDGRRSPTNDHTPQFGLLAAEPRAARTLVEALVELPARSLSLSHLDTATADALRRTPRLAASRGAIDSPRVDLAGSWERYEAALSKNVRGDVRRRRRRLEEAGVLELDLRASLDRLEEGFAVEGSGWKDAAGTAIRSRPETLSFYRDVAAWADARGSLRLCFLELDGRAIAFHFDLDEHGSVYHLKGGYDPAHERFSPGKVLHYAVLEEAFATGAEHYEFLGSPDSYKLQFANATSRVEHLQLFRRAAGGAAAYAVTAYGRPLAKRAFLSARGAVARRARRTARRR